jgi:KDO2-lipid IV(A) lauroyltransferase
MWLSRIASGFLFYGVLKPLSRLPLPVLYAISSILWWPVFYLFPYRKKVVMHNLGLAFPEQDAEWRKRKAKLFYRYFLDMLVETLKVFTIDMKEMASRMPVENPEIVQEFEEQGKSLIMMSGHLSNWEWFALQYFRMGNYSGIGIYKPLTNPVFEKAIIDTRSRSGLVLCPVTEVSKFFKHHQHELFVYGFLSDQNPKDPQNAYWLPMFGHLLPFARGAERYARIYGLPVVFAHTYRLGRGRYTIRYSVLARPEENLPEGAITARFAEAMENAIRMQPEFWLWTHKRFKHIGKEPK